MTTDVKGPGPDSKKSAAIEAADRGFAKRKGEERNFSRGDDGRRRGVIATMVLKVHLVDPESDRRTILASQQKKGIDQITSSKRGGGGTGYQEKTV